MHFIFWLQVFSQDKFRQTLLKWIVVTSQPISMVEEDTFRELIGILNPTAEVISNKTIKEDLMAAYTEKVEEIKEQLKGVPGKISITMDIWTSKNFLSFLAIRAHWISIEWEYKTQLLDFSYIEDHSGSNQNCIFLQCMSRYDINLSKILAITMDNATSNDTFISSLRLHGSLNGVDISVAENQVRCLAHILNLVVQDILKSLNVPLIVNTEDDITEEVSESFSYIFLISSSIFIGRRC